AVEPVGLGENAELERFGRMELLEHRGVTDFYRHGRFLFARPGIVTCSPSQWSRARVPNEFGDRYRFRPSKPAPVPDFHERERLSLWQGARSAGTRRSRNLARPCGRDPKSRVL